MHSDAPGRTRRRQRERRRLLIQRLTLAAGIVAVAVGLTLFLVLGGGEGAHRVIAIHRPGASHLLRPAAARRKQLEKRAEAERLAETKTLKRLIRVGLPIYCGGHDGRDVALTFDDGPGAYTSLALRILRRAGARATFFLVGKELRYWKTLPRQELRLGALGDHTWTHPYLPGLSVSAIRAQLFSTRKAIEAETHVPVLLFRPPYGALDGKVRASARSLGLAVVLWSIDTRDSEGAPWYQIAKNVERVVRPGSIILMHENRGQTIRALHRLILPYLRRHRLRAVTVPELLAADPPSVRQLKAGQEGCYRAGMPAAIRGSGD